MSQSVQMLVAALMLSVCMASFSAHAEPSVSLNAERGLYVSASHSSSPARHALVIGNAAYEHIGKLRNAARDAELIAHTLASLGFSVKWNTDMTLDQMRAAIRTFGRELPAGGVGVFYYAGHGIEIAGESHT